MIVTCWAVVHPARASYFLKGALLARRGTGTSNHGFARVLLFGGLAATQPSRRWIFLNHLAQSLAPAVKTPTALRRLAPLAALQSDGDVQRSRLDRLGERLA